jgi:hypothetical protein
VNVLQQNALPGQKRKGKVMKIKDAVTIVLALALSLGALTCMTYTEQFQHAAVAESGGFDALAHDLFNGSQWAGADHQRAAGGSAR